jgi:hypothetical protein
MITPEDEKAIQKGKAYIDSILKPYEDIPNSHGMKVLRGVYDLETSKNKDVVLRTMAEDYWMKVIEATKTNRVCALGTPGIGKSTTTCVLIRLLLAQKKTVLYHMRSTRENGWVYIFTPSRNSETIDVAAMKGNVFTFKDIYNNQSTYYVVDPHRTKDDCNLDASYEGKVIIVASPDEVHWGGSEFTKNRANDMGIFLIYPVWSLQELIMSSVIFTGTDTMITIADIEERFWRFGGVPRSIFSKNYEDQKQLQNQALANLTSESAITLAFKERTGIKTFGSDLPKGILLAYILADGDNHSYRKGYVVLCSDYVYEFVAKKFMKDLWLKIASNYQSFDGKLFEAYAGHLFYDSVRPRRLMVTVRLLRNNNSTNAFKVQIGGCLKQMKVENIIDEALATQMVLFVPTSSTNKLVDFMYREGNTFYLFQCTIAKTHSARPDHILELMVKVISNRMPSMLESNPGTNTNREIHDYPWFILCYVVPEFRFKEFATNPVNAKGKAREMCLERYGEENDLWKHWNEILVIYTLCVDQPQVE